MPSKALSPATAALKAAAQSLSTQITPLGLSANNLIARVDQLEKIIVHTTDIVKDGGNIKAATLSAIEGRKTSDEAIANSADYVEFRQESRWLMRRRRPSRMARRRRCC